MLFSHTAYMREWRKRNPEKIRAINRRYYKAHGYAVGKVARKAASQRYRERHLEKIKAYDDHYRETHKQERRIYTRQWRKNNPQKRKTQRIRRRAYKEALPSTLTGAEMEKLMASGRCFYCGQTEDLTLDHFVPLSKGGGTTRANMIVACRQCNSQKRDKMPKEILKQLAVIR